MVKPRVLIVGASGLLGQTLSEFLSMDFEVHGTFLHHEPIGLVNAHQVDATSDESLFGCLELVDPEFVVNCAGLTSVDKCESQPEESLLLNYLLPVRISKILSASNTRFVHISTDHFKSKHQTPRRESECVWSVNHYGFVKLRAEQEVLSENPRSLVIRTNFFGLGKRIGTSLLDYTVNSLNSGKRLQGFFDVEFSPVGVSFLSRAISETLRSDLNGILNVASDEVVSKFEFVSLVAETLLIPRGSVERCSTKDEPDWTPRPNYLALDPSKFKYEFGVAIPTVRKMIEDEISRGGTRIRDAYR